MTWPSFDAPQSWYDTAPEHWVVQDTLADRTVYAGPCKADALAIMALMPPHFVLCGWGDEGWGPEGEADS